jgi:hypothetical protein
MQKRLIPLNSQIQVVDHETKTPIPIQVAGTTTLRKLKQVVAEQAAGPVEAELPHKSMN